MRSLAVVLLAVMPLFVSAWGFEAHRLINQFAVFTLPPALVSQWGGYAEYLSKHAVDPDKRRGAVKGEGCRHFIDADHFDQPPFNAIPRDWDGAIAQLTEDTLKAYGILPWHVMKEVKRLEYVMLEKDLERSLKIAADLGHYVADATVPLHTTENYDGQLTGQVGIHKLWETRTVEQFSSEFQLAVGKAEYIPDVSQWIWALILSSHSDLAQVLSCEVEVRHALSPDDQASVVQRGAQTEVSNSEIFIDQYHDCLNGMVEKRMRIAVLAVGSIWYTAWVNAGQPIFENQTIEENTDENE